MSARELRWRRPVCILKKFASALAVILAVSLPSVVATNVNAAGKVERSLKIPSPTLKRSIVYSIYLPEAAGVGRRFPVVYLLHGHGDDENAWLRWGNLKRTLDHLIAKQAIQPMIVVMPMAGNSWFVDDANDDGYGPVAKAFTTDLIASIDNRYRTLACRDARAVGGLSMGGYGAMLYATTNPDKFRAAISLSGSLFSESLKFERSRHPLFTGLFGGVFGSPFDHDRYVQFNVFARLEQLRLAPQKPSIWLTAGNNDFPSIVRGTKRLHKALNSMGIESHLRIDKASHEWPYWAKAIVPALKWLSPQLSRKCSNGS